MDTPDTLPRRADNVAGLFGNILGASRAEADGMMLSQAFVETPDFRALTGTPDFNFVVGRRGSGKTALYMKITEHFQRRDDRFLFDSHPEENEMLSLQSTIRRFEGNYKSTRAMMRVTWRAHLLFKVLEGVLKYWKLDRSSSAAFLRGYANEHRSLLKLGGIGRCVEILGRARAQGSDVHEVPGLVASNLRLGDVQESVDEVLRDSGKPALFLFDGLDEGWAPDQQSTAILGGLALAMADFVDRKSEIHGILFMRDNIFRALAHLDMDYSRHIEGNTLRLRWDEGSLLHLVANRLRVALRLESTQNDIKVWNRFAQRGLQDREGFARCLQQTLLRPRDVLVLLNQAFVAAARSGRTALVEADVEATATQISRDRLSDLIKEYDAVFPGIELVLRSFHGAQAFATVAQRTDYLDAVARNDDYSQRGASDFAIFGGGHDLLSALHGIGFIGLEDVAAGRFSFCHDGAPSALDTRDAERRTAIHPCYWLALDVLANEPAPGILTDVHDDENAAPVSELKDLRTRQLGQLVAQVPKLPLGQAGSTDFEAWVFRAIRILFAGSLANPELKPNADATQRRDIVATNSAERGFWRRVFEDYGSRQVVFEVKNFQKLEPADFRQIASYLTGAYGRFGVLITRSELEGLDESDRGWVRTTWVEHTKMILVLPVSFLVRCLRKQRNVDRYDYTDDALGKRLDVFSRKYVSQRHERGGRAREEET